MDLVGVEPTPLKNSPVGMNPMCFEPVKPPGVHIPIAADMTAAMERDSTNSLLSTNILSFVKGCN